MIKVACSGFPVNQKKYRNQLRTVELVDLFDSFPRPSTIEKWGASAGAEFEYVVCASRLITHPEKQTATHVRSTKFQRIGYFQDSEDVKNAFQKSWGTAVTLKSKIILFQCPDHWAPHPDHAKRIHNFFKPLPRGNKHFVWQPPSAWPESLIENLNKTLGITSAINPLAKNYKPIKASMRYFRIGANGKTKGQGALSDLELKDIKKACDLPLSYVVFNNGPTSFSDAVRFQSQL